MDICAGNEILGNMKSPLMPGTSLSSYSLMLGLTECLIFNYVIRNIDLFHNAVVEASKVSLPLRILHFLTLHFTK